MRRDKFIMKIFLMFKTDTGQKGLSIQKNQVLMDNGRRKVVCCHKITVGKTSDYFFQ